MPNILLRRPRRASQGFAGGGASTSGGRGFGFGGTGSCPGAGRTSIGGGSGAAARSSAGVNPWEVLGFCVLGLAVIAAAAPGVVRLVVRRRRRLREFA